MEVIRRAKKRIRRPVCVTDGCHRKPDKSHPEPSGKVLFCKRHDWTNCVHQPSRLFGERRTPPSPTEEIQES